MFIIQSNRYNPWPQMEELYSRFYAGKDRVWPIGAYMWHHRHTIKI